jgi:hypothetical protein
MLKKIIVFLISLHLSSQSFSQISDEVFLNRVMSRAEDCFDKQIDIAMKQKINDIDFIFTNCYGLITIYDNFVMTGKSAEFQNQFLIFQKPRWYKKILARIDVYKNNSIQKQENQEDSARGSLYFYAQLRGQMKILDVSFNYCDYGETNKIIYKDTLAKFTIVLNAVSELIVIERNVKYRNNETISFLENTLNATSNTVNETLIDLFTGSKKELMCERAKNQFLGKDRKIIELINMTISAVEPKVKEITKVNEAIKKIELYLENLLKEFDRGLT